MQKYEQGFIVDPVVLSASNTVADVIEIKRTQGFTGVPITATGRMGGKLVGLVTQRDVDFLPADKHATPLADVRLSRLLFCHLSQWLGLLD